MQKCTSFLRLSASLPDKWLGARYVYTEAGGEGGQCRIGAGKGGCNDADGKNISTANPRWPSAANKGSISSPAAGRGCSVARRTITAGFRVTGTGN